MHISQLLMPPALTMTMVWGLPQNRHSVVTPHRKKSGMRVRSSGRQVSFQKLRNTKKPFDPKAYLWLICRKRHDNFREKKCCIFVKIRYNVDVYMAINRVLSPRYHRMPILWLIFYYHMTFTAECLFCGSFYISRCIRFRVCWYTLALAMTYRRVVSMEECPSTSAK